MTSRSACCDQVPRRRGIAAALLLAASAAACAAGNDDRPTPLPPSAVILHELGPAVVLPGTRLLVQGDNFVTQASHLLVIAGALEGHAVELRLPLTVVSPQRARTQLEPGQLQGLGTGPMTAQVRVESTNDVGTTPSEPLSVTLVVEQELSPGLQAVGDGLVHVNSRVAVWGTGLLLGGAEGETVVRLEGCFVPGGLAQGLTCDSNGKQVKHELRVSPDSPTERQHGAFELPPEVFGIKPGNFKGNLTPINRHAGGQEVEGAALPVAFDLARVRIDRLDQQRVSLGQLLDIRGAGFVGQGGSTVIGFSGTFTPVDGGPRPVSFEIVSGFKTGAWVQHVLEERLGIGASVDLRKEMGTLSGTWTPTVLWGNDTEAGLPISLAVDVAPVKQVVWLNFSQEWQQGLRRFGLQAGSSVVQQRVLQVMQRDYRGINVELRTGEPEDFKLFARVDIGGRDPNGLGLLGYDNTPGKDVDNQRLYDWIGGVNALTQQDGYPGYGGVFVESMLSFSTHPPTGVPKSPLSSSLFDDVFDPFRPDRGGVELTAAEALAAQALPPGAAACAGTERVERARCALSVLGNLVGNTASHEMGHSLGLADPYGPATEFHNPGDKPNRMMDGGHARPFAERAELAGQGPAAFCDEEYSYLRKILPLYPPDDPPVDRPDCY